MADSDYQSVESGQVMLHSGDSITVEVTFTDGEPIHATSGAYEWSMGSDGVVHYYDAFTKEPIDTKIWRTGSLLHPVWGTARRPARPPR